MTTTEDFLSALWTAFGQTPIGLVLRTNNRVRARGLLNSSKKTHGAGPDCADAEIRNGRDDAELLLVHKKYRPGPKALSLD